MNPFLRTELLLGPSAMDTLRKCHVAVFGVGGVGGYVVEALARCGVGAIDIVDNDIVDITNLNRQVVALRSNVGQEKVDVCRRRILEINPDCRVTAHSMFYLPENADSIDLAAYDYVVDCIDTVSAKLELACRCHELGTPLLASLGTARKLDPTRLRISDVTKTHTDPLAKVMRKKLREMGVAHLKCVWSDELPAPMQQKDSPLPSCIFVPAAAGLLAANHVILSLTGKLS